MSKTHTGFHDGAGVSGVICAPVCDGPGKGTRPVDGRIAFSAVGVVQPIITTCSMPMGAIDIFVRHESGTPHCPKGTYLCPRGECGIKDAVLFRLESEPRYGVSPVLSNGNMRVMRRHSEYSTVRPCAERIRTTLFSNLSLAQVIAFGERLAGSCGPHLLATRIRCDVCEPAWQKRQLSIPRWSHNLPDPYWLMRSSRLNACDARRHVVICTPVCEAPGHIAPHTSVKGCAPTELYAGGVSPSNEGKDSSSISVLDLLRDVDKAYEGAKQAIIEQHNMLKLTERALKEAKGVPHIIHGPNCAADVAQKALDVLLASTKAQPTSELLCDDGVSEFDYVSDTARDVICMLRMHSPITLDALIDRQFEAAIMGLLRHAVGGYCPSDTCVCDLSHVWEMVPSDGDTFIVISLVVSIIDEARPYQRHLRRPIDVPIAAWQEHLCAIGEVIDNTVEWMRSQYHQLCVAFRHDDFSRMSCWRRPSSLSDFREHDQIRCDTVSKAVCIIAWLCGILPLAFAVGRLKTPAMLGASNVATPPHR